MPVVLIVLVRWLIRKYAALAYLLMIAHSMTLHAVSHTQSVWTRQVICSKSLSPRRRGFGSGWRSSWGTTRPWSPPALRPVCARGDPFRQKPKVGLKDASEVTLLVAADMKMFSIHVLCRLMKLLWLISGKPCLYPTAEQEEEQTSCAGKTLQPEKANVSHEY